MSRFSPGSLAALVIAAIAGVYLVLVGFVLDPLAFFIGDPGVKYLQAENLVHAGWGGFAVRNPAPRIDPEGDFTALAYNQFGRRSKDAPFHGVYSEVFTVPVSFCLSLFGARGLYVVPIVASIVTMVLAYRLSVRTSPRAAWLAPLLVGACSPMAFYSLDLWEHTLATMLVTASVLSLLAATAPFSARRVACAGFLLGAAIAVREELYAMLPAVLVMLARFESRRRLPALLAAGAGGVAALIPYWSLRSYLFGHFARSPLLRVVGLETAPYALTSATQAIGLIVPTSAGWLVSLVALLLVRWWLPRTGGSQRRGWLIMLAALVSILACADAIVFARSWTRPDDLLRAFPALLFLLFLPPGGRDAPRGSGEIRTLLLIAALFGLALCVAAPLSMRRGIVGGAQWGPRFLMPVYPLLAAGIVFALEQRAAWAADAVRPRRLIAGVCALVVLASIGVQAQGLRDLRAAKRGYGQLLAAVDALRDGEVVVTDIWWYPTIVAAKLYQHETLAVEQQGVGTLPAVLERLQQRGITSFTLVTAGPESPPALTDALAAAGWTERERRTVPIWLEVDFITYRHDALSE